MNPPERIRLHLFGRLRVERGSVKVEQFATRRSGHILARLAMAHQRRLSRPQLAETLWPADDYEVSRVRLRQELLRLRRALGELQDVLVTESDSVRLDMSNLDVDVLDFERLLGLAKREQDEESRKEFLRTALSSSSAPLLSEFTDDWIVMERVRLNHSRYGALIEVGQLTLEGGFASDALALSAEALELIPDREAAHLLAVRALERLGNPSAAKGQFETLRRVVGTLSQDAVDLEASLVSPGRSDVRLALRFSVPSGLVPLLGRRQAAEQVKGLFATGTRLVSVLGMGGIGKTRLLLHVCESLAAQYEGRIAFIDLTDLSDSRLVAGAILHSLGLGFAATGDLMGRLVPALAGAPVLLALDNLEQFGSDLAPVVRQLLAGIPNLSILAGSRSALNVAGEFRLRLEPLEVPAASAQRKEAEESPAMKLFLHALEADQIRHTLQPEDWPVISNIVRRVDGMPLGLQLAAARMRTLGPVALLRDLEEGFDRLENRYVDAPERHRSIRNAVTGSLDQLDSELREALAALSVFRGGWTLEAAQKVCAIQEMAPVLERLAGASLVTVSRQRFRMVETIREYADELLEPRKRAELRQRLLDWMVERSRLVGQDLVDRKTLAEFDRLEEEIDNLRLALRTALDTDPESAFILAGNLHYFWMCRTTGDEAEAFYMELFDRYGDAPASKNLLRAWFGWCVVAQIGGAGEPRAIFDRTLRLGRELGDLSFEIKVRVLQAYFAQGEIRYDECRHLFEQIDRFVDEHGDFESAGFVSRVKGNFAHYQGDSATAIAHFRDAVAWFNARGESIYLLRTRMNLSFAAIESGDLDLAAATINGLAQLASEIRFVSLIPSIHSSEGRLALREGRTDEALAAFEVSLREWQDMGSSFQAAEQWYAIGRTHLIEGRVAEAQGAFGMAADLWRTESALAASIALVGLTEVRLRSGEISRANRMFQAASAEFAKLQAKHLPFQADFNEEVGARLRAHVGDVPQSGTLLTLEEAIQMGKLPLAARQ